MSYLISMFIDNELGLDEKVEFLKKIREDKGLYEDSIGLLEQEKMIRTDMVAAAPAVQIRLEEKRKWFSLPSFRPFAALASAGAMAVIIVMLLLNLQTTPTDSVSYRFVIYKPDVSDVEISGSFTDWEVVPLTKVGSTGYWEVELNVPKGEHRYSFILEKEHRIADPTVFARETDDFGGENSILFMSA